MKNALVIQHVAFEDLGHLEPVLRARGYRITTYRPPTELVWTIDIAHVNLLVILGGPMSANDGEVLEFIGDELQLVQTALDKAVPVLGICLGAQIIAAAAGGSVHPMESAEIGLGPVKLTEQGRLTCLRHLSDSTPVLHWHGEAIALPPNAVCLASTAQCEVQAFAIGQRVLGLQFHLETDLDRVPEWTQGHATDVKAAGVDADRLIADARDQAPTAANVCRLVAEEWLNGL